MLKLVNRVAQVLSSLGVLWVAYVVFFTDQAVTTAGFVVVGLLVLLSLITQFLVMRREPPERR